LSVTFYIQPSSQPKSKEGQRGTYHIQSIFFLVRLFLLNNFLQGVIQRKFKRRRSRSHLHTFELFSWIALILFLSGRML
jgi:hypothetical protein